MCLFTACAKCGVGCVPQMQCNRCNKDVCKASNGVVSQQLRRLQLVTAESYLWNIYPCLKHITLCLQEGVQCVLYSARGSAAACLPQTSVAESLSWLRGIRCRYQCRLAAYRTSLTVYASLSACMTGQVDTATHAAINSAQHTAPAICSCNMSVGCLCDIFDTNSF